MQRCYCFPTITDELGLMHYRSYNCHQNKKLLQKALCNDWEMGNSKNIKIKTIAKPNTSLYENLLIIWNDMVLFNDIQLFNISDVIFESSQEHGHRFLCYLAYRGWYPFMCLTTFRLRIYSQTYWKKFPY